MEINKTLLIVLLLAKQAMDICIKDYEEIRKVEEVYMKGCNGNTALLKTAFHENATINGEPIQTLYDFVDKEGEANSRAAVDVLDVTGDAAVVRIAIEGLHGHVFVDYHALIKGEDGWKSVAKIYEQTSK